MQYFWGETPLSSTSLYSPQAQEPVKSPKTASKPTDSYNEYYTNVKGSAFVQPDAKTLAIAKKPTKLELNKKIDVTVPHDSERCFTVDCPTLCRLLVQVGCSGDNCDLHVSVGKRVGDKPTYEKNNTTASKFKILKIEHAIGTYNVKLAYPKQKGALNAMIKAQLIAEVTLPTPTQRSKQANFGSVVKDTLSPYHDKINFSIPVTDYSDECFGLDYGLIARVRGDVIGTLTHNTASGQKTADESSACQALWLSGLYTMTVQSKYTLTKEEPFEIETELLKPKVDTKTCDAPCKIVFDGKAAATLIEIVIPNEPQMLTDVGLHQMILLNIQEYEGIERYHCKKKVNTIRDMTKVQDGVKFARSSVSGKHYVLVYDKYWQTRREQATVSVSWKMITPNINLEDTMVIYQNTLAHATMKYIQPYKTFICSTSGPSKITISSTTKRLHIYANQGSDYAHIKAYKAKSTSNQKKHTLKLQNDGNWVITIFDTWYARRGPAWSVDFTLECNPVRQTTTKASEKNSYYYATSFMDDSVSVYMPQQE